MCYNKMEAGQATLFPQTLNFRAPFLVPLVSDRLFYGHF